MGEPCRGGKTWSGRMRGRSALLVCLAQAQAQRLVLVWFLAAIATFAAPNWALRGGFPRFSRYNKAFAVEMPNPWHRGMLPYNGLVRGERTVHDEPTICSCLTSGQLEGSY